MKGRKLLLASVLVVSLCGCDAGRDAVRNAYLSANYRIVRIPTEHMSPTIKPGDFAAIDESYYSRHPVRRFEMVIFKHPQPDEATGEKDTIHLQRVIALGGETVEIHGATVYIDGKERSQPFLLTPHDPAEEFEKLTVPEGEYFLLGDNRTNTLDSRSWKKPTIDKSHIYGRVVEVIPQ